MHSFWRLKGENIHFLFLQVHCYQYLLTNTQYTLFQKKWNFSEAVFLLGSKVSFILVYLWGSHRHGPHQKCIISIILVFPARYCKAENFIQSNVYSYRCTQEWEMGTTWHLDQSLDTSAETFHKPLPWTQVISYS